jgi:hypothetical protein
VERDGFSSCVIAGYGHQASRHSLLGKKAVAGQEKTRLGTHALAIRPASGAVAGRHAFAARRPSFIDRGD